MTRRTLLLTIPALVVAADLAGTRRKERADRSCRRLGEVLERRGLTERERARLSRSRCRKVGDEWLSTEYYEA